MAAIELDASVVDLQEEPEVIVVNAPKKRATKPKVEKPKVEKPKVEKPKKEKPKKEVIPICNVPKRNSPIKSVMWMRHIHEMMIEAQVPIISEIVTAYNQVIQFLEGYQTVIIHGPSKHQKYTAGILPQESSWYPIYIRVPHTFTHAQRLAFIADLKTIYCPLHTLIKDKVEPYMKQREETHDIHNKLEYKKREIRGMHEQIEKEVERHKELMKRYHSQLIYLQNTLDTYQKKADVNPL